MTESNTQAVATDAEATAAPSAEAMSAQNTTPSLDQLLSEFDKDTAKPEPAPQPKPQATVADSELAREVAALKFKIDIEPTLKRVRGDIPVETLSDEELLDLLDGRAKRDEALRNAFLNRGANPRKWAQVEKALNADLSKRFKPSVDANTTADVNAVAAAVRGTSTKVPEEKPPNYGAMNNADFQKELAKHGIS